MFLRLGRSNLFTKLSIALGLMTGVACGQPAFPCYVDLPVYSGAGVRLPFRIVAAEADGDSASLRISARLQIPRLEYQKDVLTLGKVLVTLEDEKRKRLRTNVEIVACIQQTSLV